MQRKQASAGTRGTSAPRELWPPPRPRRNAWCTAGPHVEVWCAGAHSLTAWSFQPSRGILRLVLSPFVRTETCSVVHRSPAASRCRCHQQGSVVRFRQQHRDHESFVRWHVRNSRNGTRSENDRRPHRGSVSSARTNPRRGFRDRTADGARRESGRGPTHR